MAYEWLIDLMKEWVTAQAYLTHCYVPVPDANGCPHGIGDFVLDGDWHELDLSPCVPAGVSAVNLSLGFRADVAEAAVFWKSPAETWPPGKVIGYTQVANIYNRRIFACDVDATRIVEYKFDNVNWTYIGFVVRGWWL